MSEEETAQSRSRDGGAAVPQLAAPGKFDFSKVTEWPRWLKRFERYRIASGLDKQSQEFQVNSFMYAAGDDAEDILNVLPLTDAQKKSYNAVTAAFTDHCVSKRNVIFERARFNRRSQEPGESVESFITAVHTLAEHCEFGPLREQLIRDRIVVGIRDAKLSESLQLDAELTLEKAMTRVRQSEAVKRQQPVLRGIEQQPSQVEAVHKKNQRTFKTAKDRTDTSGCSRCGQTKKHSRTECPARDAECRKCHKKGHFAKRCRTGGGVHNITELQKRSEDEEDFAFLGEMDSVEEDEWIETLHLNGKQNAFKLDTGASVTAIPSSMYSPQKYGTLQPPGKILYGPGKQKLDVRGRFKGTLCIDQKTTNQDVYVVTGLYKPLLGLPAIRALNLIKRVNSVQVQPVDFKAQYPAVFSGLGKLNQPYKIELETGAVPYALSTPRRVPLPLREKVKAELERMEDMGVISRVTEPTPWCAGMVVAPKSRPGKIRLCVDLTHLNKWVRRERHILPAVDHTLAMLAGAKVFTKLDATSGFWQIPLAEESRLLTTFITPFGRYAFNRLPFGISSAPEHFQRRMSQMLEGCEGVVCHADDIVVFGEDMQQHNERLHKVLQRLGKEGLTLNEKCEFAKDCIMFVGHCVTAEGVSPDPGKVRAIMEMPEPKDTEGVRRVMGMANYLGKFLPHLASYTKPLKDLLSEKNEWHWGGPQGEAFQKLKSELSSPRVLAPYSMTAETCVAADASSYGLGAVLTQEQTDGTWKPIVFISRGLTEAEKHYAQIEKEALAVTWACERLSPYIMGLRFKLETDHKPLVPLLSTKALDELPPRVLRFRLRLMKFTFDIVHVPGKRLITADTLSRAPVKHKFTQDELNNETEVKVFVDAVIQSLPATEPRLQAIQEKQKSDAVCAKLIQYCKAGWPEKNALAPDVRPYWTEKDNITLAGELLVRGQRLVIPQSLRQEILDQLHSGHQGIVKCRARARQSVWWPGLSVQISQLVENCNTCSQHRAEYREPLLTTPVPKRPWQRVGTDLFFWEKESYILIVDYFSRYIEVARLNVPSAATVIAAIKETFSRHGIPETVVSDNGPQYSSDLFKDFAAEYGFIHTTSSPRYPQANGKAERAVATIKGLWKGGGDKTKALLTYRATPLECDHSPAQLLMGRQLRTTLPQHPVTLLPRWPNMKDFRTKQRRSKVEQQRRYNRRHRARPLTRLQPGQSVWLPRDNKEGIVVQEAATPRSYVINTDEGQIRRNRVHMRALCPSTPPDIVTPTAEPSTDAPTNTASETHNNKTPADTGGTPYVTASGRVSRPPKRLNL